jgi:hypothetical protein
MADDLNPQNLLELGMSFWASKAFLSSVEIGLYTSLAAGPKTLPELMAEHGLHPRSAVDFLDSLVALGLLDRSDDKYSNTPLTEAFLDRNKPSYVGGMLEMANARLYPFWANLTEALKTGEPQNEAKGGGPNPFEAMYADPAGLRGFLEAMTGLSTGTGIAMAQAFPWKDYTSFADIGCAQGALPVQIAKAHPHLTGVGFDLPQVGPIFSEFVASHDLTDRVSFVGGNFLSDEPLPSAEVLVMGHILHDWPFETKFQLLQKAYDALPDGGALVVYDAIIDDERRTNVFGLLMSLNMLIETPGGFDYTGADCQGWMNIVGFSETRVQPLLGPESMVIGIK